MTRYFNWNIEAQNIRGQDIKNFALWTRLVGWSSRFYLEITQPGKLFCSAIDKEVVQVPLQVESSDRFRSGA